MSKGDYGIYTEDQLSTAFRDTHDQHCAYKFGETLADKIYDGVFDTNETDTRIDKACKKNAHWKREYVQYAFDKEYAYRMCGNFIEPIYPKNDPRDYRNKEAYKKYMESENASKTIDVTDLYKNKDDLDEHTNKLIDILLETVKNNSSNIKKK